MAEPETDESVHVAETRRSEHENADMRALGDVGGTFTDAVLVEDGRIRVAKVPTVTRQQDAVVGAAAVGAADIDRFTHGTTIATNALLERRGARTALVTNEGFEHVLHLRRQTRAHLYRPCVHHRRRSSRSSAASEPRSHGTERRARPARPRHAPADRRRGDRRIAPVLVPRRGARAPRRRRARTALPVRTRRGVARGGARVPRVRARLDDCGRRVPRPRSLALPPCTRGSLCRRRAPGAARHALVGRPRHPRGGRACGVRAALRAGCRAGSGAAGGARGLRERPLVRHGRHLDRCLRDRRRRGAAARARATGRWPRSVSPPSPCTPSARGQRSSSGWTRAARFAGPRAQARIRGLPATGGAECTRRSPTPICSSGACRRRSPAGSSSTRQPPARAGSRRSGGVVDVVNAEMVRASSRLGRAGARSARFRARRIRRRRPAARLRARSGARHADRARPGRGGCPLRARPGRRGRTATRCGRTSPPSPTQASCPTTGEADLRYAGQSFEAPVPLGPDLAERFHDAHEARYGYADRERSIELVAVRTAERRAAPPMTVTGPAITTRGPAGARARRRDSVGSGRLVGRDGRARDADAEQGVVIDIELQVIGASLRAIAEEMGATLIRSAFSANIKERRDCSTALFDERGRMVTQAEHIPVHLGAMPEAVAAVMAHEPAPGEPWILNDPYAGGTHLGSHDRHAHRARIRRDARAPRGRRRLRARKPAPGIAHAGRGGRHPSDAARRCDARVARLADAKSRRTARRPARPARRQPAGRDEDRQALRAARPGSRHRGDGRAPRVLGARRPRSHPRAPRRTLRGAPTGSRRRSACWTSERP